MFRSMDGPDGRGDGRAHGGMIQGWHEQKVTTPYSVSLPFEDKRLLAQVKKGVRAEHIAALTLGEGRRNVQCWLQGTTHYVLLKPLTRNPPSYVVMAEYASGLT